MAPSFRIFNIASGNYHVSISGLTISNGFAGDDAGGGIYTQAATLDLCRTAGSLATWHRSAVGSKMTSARSTSPVAPSPATSGPTAAALETAARSTSPTAPSRATRQPTAAASSGGTAAWSTSPIAPFPGTWPRAARAAASTAALSASPTAPSPATRPATMAAAFSTRAAVAFHRERGTRSSP